MKIIDRLNELLQALSRHQLPLSRHQLPFSESSLIALDAETVQQVLAAPLRAIAIDHMLISDKARAHRYRLAAHKDQIDIHDVLSTQAKDRVYGRDDEAVALGEAFQINIHIHRVGDFPYLAYEASTDAPSIYLKHNGRDHWDLLGKSALPDGNCLYNALALGLQDVMNRENQPCASGEVSPTTSSASFASAVGEQQGGLDVNMGFGSSLFIAVSETGAPVKPASPEAHNQPSQNSPKKSGSFWDVSLNVVKALIIVGVVIGLGLVFTSIGLPILCVLAALLSVGFYGYQAVPHHRDDETVVDEENDEIAINHSYNKITDVPNCAVAQPLNENVVDAGTEPRPLGSGNPLANASGSESLGKTMTEAEARCYLNV